MLKTRSKKLMALACVLVLFCSLTLLGSSILADTGDIEPSDVVIDITSSSGTVTADVSSALPGDTVTLTTTAEWGIWLVPGSLTYTVANITTEVPMNDGVYSFVMPDGDVTVTAEFEAVDYTTTTDSIWNGDVADTLAGGSGTTADPYMISSAEQLAKLAEMVNTKNTQGAFSGYKFFLTNDLYLSGQAVSAEDVDVNTAGVSGYLGDSDEIIVEWTPIGGGTTSASFGGSFDGYGHIIYNIFYNHSDGSYSNGSTIKNNIGLFGKVEADGEVKNLGIGSGYIGGQRSVGGIAGVNYGTVSACFNGATVYGNQSKGVGGIAGASWTTTSGSAPAIENCYNFGTVITEYDTGDAGGIAGNNEGALLNCYSNGTVTGNDGANVGGIAGNHDGSSASLVNCHYLEGSAVAGIGKTSLIMPAVEPVVTSDQLKALAETLGGAYAKGDDRFNNGYPVLSWQHFTCQVDFKTYPKRADISLKGEDGLYGSVDGYYLVPNGTYTYTVSMNNYVTVSGTVYVDGADVVVDVTLNAKADLLSDYTDLDLTQWYGNAVIYSVANNLFVGTNSEYTLWSPEEGLTRAMFVTVLGKYEDIDTGLYETCVFDDVDKGEWYTAYIQWAYATELVKGTGNNEFSPDDTITREEMARIFYLYAEGHGADMTVPSDNYNNFPDKGDTAQWAVSAMTWATGKGIINGFEDSTLRPQETTDRSQAAQVFMRVIEDIL